MMRIKEAIQRKKLIHEMNYDWKDFDGEGFNGYHKVNSSPPVATPSPDCRGKDRTKTDDNDDNQLQTFVQYLSGKLTDYQKRALKVTWKRLSEAPKTSGRGTIHIMEKVLDKLCETEPGITAIFYKSAFLSCIEDRRCGRTRCGSIATIRDHAHILVEFIDSILQSMFEGPVNKPGLDPDSIGAAHSRLRPLGFDRRYWHTLGECFAEVMFMQECIRAYPHAPSAWSLLSVAMTDRMYASGKSSSATSSQSSLFLDHQPTFDRPPRSLTRGQSIDTAKAKRLRAEYHKKDTSCSPLKESTTATCVVPESLEDEDVFLTARENFDTVEPQDDMSTSVCRSRLPRCPQRRAMRFNTTSVASIVRETAIEPPGEFPICVRIPKAKMMRSKSEVRFGGVSALTRTTDL